MRTIVPLGVSPLKASSTKAEADRASLAASQSPQPWEMWKLQGEGSRCCILQRAHRARWSERIELDLGEAEGNKPGELTPSSPSPPWSFCQTLLLFHFLRFKKIKHQCILLRICFRDSEYLDMKGLKNWLKWETSPQCPPDAENIHSGTARHESVGYF